MAWADKALAFPGRAKRDDWVGQAALLAKGKETEFSKRVDKGQVSSSKKA
jgi:branched-chain amino acid transport system ATP-binding protein